MLVATLLRRKIAALETAGKLRGEVVIVPVPNPIGLSQHVFGDHLGRFETGSMQNFNRNFYDLAALVLPRVEHRLTHDAQHNLVAVRAAMREALDEQKPRTELDSQRLALQKLSFDADIVLDLHCDSDAVMHLYTNPDLWPDVEPLSRYLDAQASLLALNSVGNPFDEIHSFCWSDLRNRFGDRFPIPNGAISVTIELRSGATCRTSSPKGRTGDRRIPDRAWGHRRHAGAAAAARASGHAARGHRSARRTGVGRDRVPHAGRRDDRGR